MAQFKRAWRDTWASIKSRGLPEVAITVLVFLGTLAASWRFRSVRADVGPALTALLVTLALAAAYVVVVFLHHLHRASLQLEVDRLQPGPEFLVAEQERMRSLRSWVGMLRSESRDVRHALDAARTSGRYPDPVHKPLRMARFKESGGLLASDARTAAAFQACDELRRGLTSLTDRVRERWYESCGTMLPPELFHYEPEVETGDDLEAVIEAARRADKELEGAMRKLDEATP
jgi:hypothetical protein